MRTSKFDRIIVLVGCVLIFSGIGLAEEVVDRTLPDHTGIPTPELAPWTGLEGGDLRPVGVIDDFNRADGPLGPDWTVQADTMSIENQAATGVGPALATHNSATGDRVEIDVEIDPAGILQYAAVILNYGGGVTNLFVKVQNNNAGPTFDRIFCYVGNQGGPWGEPYYFDLAEQFGSARMAVSVDPARDVHIEFTNVDGGALQDQQYTCVGAPPAEGPGIGIGAHRLGDANVRIDNFGDGPVPVELMTFSVE